MRIFRNAWQRLAAHPGYSLLSVSVLGIGLGAVLFLFGLVNGLILEPLPFPHADRLTAIGYVKPRDSGIDKLKFSEYQSLASALQTTDATGVYAELPVDLVDGTAARHYYGCLLSEQMLNLLGAHPVLGRSFEARDELPGAALTALIGEQAWRRDFHADAAIVGRAIRLNGEVATVIGVMPDSFSFPSISEVWLPGRLRVEDASDVNVVSRLKPGVSLTQARAELQTVAATLGNRLEGQRAGRQLVLKPLALSFVSETTRGFVWVMFAAGLLVLLLACANVANLRLGQTLNRRRELAVRSALGATRSCLLREQLADCLMLSAGATALALLLAFLGTRWLEGILTANGKTPAYYIHLGIDFHLLLFAAAAALLTTVLAGFFPAWRASRTDVQDALRDGDKGSHGDTFARVAKALVVIEIVLTVVLLVGAGTFVQGLQRMFAATPGSSADPAHILTASLDLFDQQYPQGADRIRFFESVMQRLRGDPEVESATAANTIPGALLGSHEFVAALGQARPEGGYQRAEMGIVDEQFAQTYGIRVTAGRFFDARDQDTSSPVTVIDEQTAAALWPGRDALGQRLVVNPEQTTPTTLTVIGISVPMQLDGALETPSPGLLVPLRQAGSQSPLHAVGIAVRTRSDALAFSTRLAGIVRGVDANIPLYALRSQAQAISMGRSTAVVLTQVFSAIGSIALLLAAAGLYGVLAFSVAQRTREIGIRRAIGASSGAIINHVGMQLLLQLAIGLAIGVALALPWSRKLANPLMHTKGYDPGVFLPVLAVVVVIALLASLLPLQKALRVDPVIALRHD